MKKIEVIKRMPTRHELEEYRRHRRKDIEVIGGACMLVIIIAASLLLIG